VDPKAEAFYGWSGYNSNLDNPILNKDPEGDVPDNYYRNESGDLVAVARTNDNVDNFYTVNNDNSVVHDATRTKDEGWSRLNDDKKNGVVNRVAENKGQAPENQVNGDGLTIDQQKKAEALTGTSGSAVSGAAAAGTPMVEGSIKKDGSPIVGVYSTGSEHKGSLTIVTSDMPVNPGGFNGVVPAGTLPTPAPGEKATIPSSNPGPFMPNQSVPYGTGAEEVGDPLPTRRTTDKNGNITPQ
jgi:hypothetical protein